MSHNLTRAAGALAGLFHARARRAPAALGGATLVFAFGGLALSAELLASLLPLARCMLALGVGATIAANVLYGTPFGALGAVISARPTVAFIGTVEVLLGMVYSAASAPAVHPESAPTAAMPPSANGHGTRDRARMVVSADVAERTYASTLASGALPSIHRIRADLGVDQQHGRQIREYLASLTPLTIT